MTIQNEVQKISFIYVDNRSVILEDVIELFQNPYSFVDDVLSSVLTVGIELNSTNFQSIKDYFIQKNNLKQLFSANEVNTILDYIENAYKENCDVLQIHYSYSL